MNFSTEKKIVDMENRLVVAKRGGSRREWEFGVNRCKLPKRLPKRSCCIALGTMSDHLWWSMIMWEKRMCTCMCDWVTLPCSRKLTVHCKSAIMEKIKIIVKKKKKKWSEMNCLILEDNKLVLWAFCSWEVWCSPWGGSYYKKVSHKEDY